MHILICTGTHYSHGVPTRTFVLIHQPDTMIHVATKTSATRKRHIPSHEMGNASMYLSVYVHEFVSWRAGQAYVGSIAKNVESLPTFTGIYSGVKPTVELDMQFCF